MLAVHPSFDILHIPCSREVRTRIWRRLIKLIFRGQNRMVMIRRELLLTNFASPAKPVAQFRRGFLFVLAPAAADVVLGLNYAVHPCPVFDVAYLEGFVLLFGPRQLSRAG